MNRFSMKKITNFHTDVLEHTQLGQMCGSNGLFQKRYKILRIIGRGGFGVTFLAKNMALPGYPLCVIKQLRPQVTSPKSRQKARERFEKEATALGQLGNHSQVPMLLDYFEANGEFYLVQEYIRGSTLAREVRRKGPKSEAEVKQFLQEVLPILNYIHSNSVIHRDIKPQNLLRCKDDGRLVLIDFGAVKDELVNATEYAKDKTVSTNFVGTMGFAPPEQFSLRPVHASDIYAVGVTSIYLLTGKAPLEFDHDSRTGEISWQNQVNVSNNFAQVLDRMIKISLQDRYKSASDVIWALGLESHAPLLKNCLSSQRLGEVKKNQSYNSHSGYLPPVARTAIAIREWKQKLKSSQSRSRMVSYLSTASH
ncbi:MAG: serine/threonine-protein kinase [Cyanobacteria bacterium P01_A01_bin.45]